MTDKIILHIVGPLAPIASTQFGVELDVDPVTGFVMWGGKDNNGAVTKWLALDKNARIADLDVTGDFTSLAIEFKENLAPSPSERTMDWHEGENAPAFYSGVSDTRNIVGKHLNIPLAQNDTVSDIAAGAPCRVTTPVSGRPGIEPLSSLMYTVEDTIVFPKDLIPAGASGECHWFGPGENLDTDPFSADDKLYLSETAGVLTNVAPVDKVYVGRCLVSSTTEGRILFIGVSGGNAAHLLHPAPEYIDFVTGQAMPPYKKGRMAWDEENDCPAYYDSISGTLVQVPKEVLVDGCNDTGVTVLNGRVVCGSGSDGVCLNVSLANAGTYDRSNVLALATHDVPTKNLPTETGRGKFTKIGKVNDFDTSHLDEGKVAYVDIVDGMLSSTRPGFPAKAIIAGYCIKSNATEGIFFVDLVSDQYDYEFDGCIIEKHNYFIVEDGGDLYLDAELLGGGDIPVQLDGNIHLLDCTVAGGGVGNRARVQLTPGVDTDPQSNYPFISLIAGVPTLQNSLTEPSGSHAKVGTLALWSVAKTVTDKVPMNRRTTDAIAHDGIGHIAHINARIRAMGSAWAKGSGGTPTATIDTGPNPDSVDLTVLAHEAWQMHKHPVPQLQLSVDGAYITNARGGVLSKYDKITDINQALQTAAGDTFANKTRFNIVFFVAVNKESDECKLFAGLPEDTYVTDEAAYRDTSQYSILAVDDSIWETVYPIARVPLNYTVVGGLSFINNAGAGEPEIVDLRGVPLNASASGTGGSVGATVLNGLTDVDASTPQDGEVLTRVASSSNYQSKPNTLQVSYVNSVAAGEDGVTLSNMGDKFALRSDDPIFGSPEPFNESGLSGFNLVKVSSKPTHDAECLTFGDKYAAWMDTTGKLWLRNSLDLAAIKDLAGFANNHVSIHGETLVHVTSTAVEYRTIPEFALEQVARTNGVVNDCHISRSGRVYFVDGSGNLVIMGGDRAVAYSSPLPGRAYSVSRIITNKAETRLYIIDNNVGTGFYVRQYNLASKTLLSSTPLINGDHTSNLSIYPDEGDSGLIYYNRVSISGGDIGTAYMEALDDGLLALGAVYSEAMPDVIGPTVFSKGMMNSIGNTAMRRYMTPGPYHRLPFNLWIPGATSIVLSNTEESSELYSLYDLANMEKRRRSDRYENDVSIKREFSQVMVSGEALDNLILDIEGFFSSEFAEAAHLFFEAHGTVRGTNAGYCIRKSYLIARDGFISGSETAVIDTITGHDTVSSVNIRPYTNWSLGDPNTILRILSGINSASTFSTTFTIDWVVNITGNVVKGVGTYC